MLLALLVAAPPAQADDGLHTGSTSRYVLDVDEQTVSATISLTLRNVAPDEPTADGGIRYYYYDAYGVPLPAQAQDVRATSGGESLTVQSRSITGERGYRLFEIGFPALRYPDSRTLELSFTLTGQPPRSEDPTRIGAGYATFPVFGPGDPGESTVEVVVPSGLEVDSTASSFTPTENPDGTTLYRTQEDNLSPGFAATMSVRSRGVGEGRAVTVGGVDLELVPYPNDPEWASFIEGRADAGLPVLVDLLGQPWPGDVDRIREDSGSQVRGFEGWYSSSEREIVLGEALEDGILFHELAHAWVNTATIEDRWLSEGLAEFLAEATVARTEGSFTTPRAVDVGDDAALPLQTWQDSPGFRGTEVDGWAYPASYQVVTQLLAGLDDDALRRVLSDVVTARSPWDLPEQRLLSGAALSSPAFLDLLAAHQAPVAADGTGSDLYAAWVLDEAGVARLAERPDTTAAYAAFAAASPWGVPLGIRRAMADWEFAEARSQLAERADLAGTATTVDELAQRTGTELPERVRRAYEGADSPTEYDAAAASISAATTALRRYEEARAAADHERNLFGRLGATVLRVEASADAAQATISLGEFTASQSASDLTLERAGWATPLGLGIVAWVALFLAAVTLIVLALWRRAGRRVAA